MQKYPTIIGILEFRLQGLSYRMIQTRYRIGASTVRDVVSKYERLGIDLEELKRMEQSKVEDLFYPPERIRRKDAPLPDFQQCYDRIHAKGSRINLMYLWFEYIEKHPDGYQLSQFYEYYNRFVKDNYGADDVVMAVERVPGERMYIDWVGDQPMLLVDTSTGELKKVHIFTTTMAYSSKVYAEIFEDEGIRCFIKGCMDAVEYYGGVARFFVPDNLKTAISKHDRDQLLVNSLFKDMENYYGTIVLPPPSRKPKGKATVEAHVRYLETHLVEKLKENVYTSLDEINMRTREIIEVINARTENRQYSRNYLFEKYDKPSLSSASCSGFFAMDYKAVSRVPDNYHIEYDDHYYSVSYTEHGKPAIVKAGFSEIQICDQYNRLLWTHHRSYKKFPRYITEASHMPPHHRFYNDVNSKDAEYYLSWARRISPNLGKFLTLLVGSYDYKEQSYLSCNAILQKCKGEPFQVVDDAAARCLAMGSIGYSKFLKALSYCKMSSAGHARSKLPEHENIRGKEEYEK